MNEITIKEKMVILTIKLMKNKMFLSPEAELEYFKKYYEFLEIKFKHQEVA